MDLDKQEDYVFEDTSYYSSYDQTLNGSYLYGDIMSGEGLDALREDVMRALSQLTEDCFVPQEFSGASKAALALLYTIVLLIAVFGNTIVVLVISSNDKLQTVTNRFLLSLAGSDLCMAFVNMPMTLVFYLKNEWIAGEFLCKFGQYLQGVFVTVNIFTLTAIAIDRYYAILYPLKVRHVHTRTRSVIVIAIIWVISLLAVSPQVVIQTTGTLLTIDLSNAEEPIRRITVCGEHFPSVSSQAVYTVGCFGLLFLIPVLVMLIAYGAIANHLWKRQPIGELPPKARDQERHHIETRSIMRMIFVIVFFFLISWLPYFFCQMYFLFHERTQTSFEVFAILQFVGYTNTCVNPVIYCFLNGKFRDCSRRLLLGPRDPTQLLCGSDRRRRMSSVSTKVIVSSDQSSNGKY